MRYFVTGATGFLGSRVVRQLRAAGHDVVALVRSTTAAGTLAGLGVQLHTGDVTDRESMRGGMAGADGILHIAGWYKLDAPGPAERINVLGTRNVLELMRLLRIPRGVYTSTLAVFSDTHGQSVNETYRFAGRHLTEYDRTKCRAHYEVALPLIREGLPLIIVQPGVIYGRGDSSVWAMTLERLARGKLWYVPAQTAYCWSYVDDAARGHLQALESGTPGESYILGGPVHTLIEALQIAARLLDVPPPRVHLSPGLVRLAATVMKGISALLRVPTQLHPEVLRAAAGVTYLGDDTKARRQLGWAPRSLEDGLGQTLADAIARPPAGQPPQEEAVVVSRTST